MEEVCRRPVRQLSGLCRALRPGWPVGVPHPPAETQAPLSGTLSEGSLTRPPSWAQRGSLTRSAQLGDPQSPSERSLLLPFWPLSLLMPTSPSFRAAAWNHSSPHYTSAGCSFIPGAPLTAQGGAWLLHWLKGKRAGGVLARETVGSTGGVPLRSQDGSAN